MVHTKQLRTSKEAAAHLIKLQSEINPLREQMGKKPLTQSTLLKDAIFSYTVAKGVKA